MATGAWWASRLEISGLDRSGRVATSIPGVPQDRGGAEARRRTSKSEPRKPENGLNSRKRSAQAAQKLRRSPTFARLLRTIRPISANSARVRAVVARSRSRCKAFNVRKKGWCQLRLPRQTQFFGFGLNQRKARQVSKYVSSERWVRNVGPTFRLKPKRRSHNKTTQTR